MSKIYLSGTTRQSLLSQLPVARSRTPDVSGWADLLPKSIPGNSSNVHIVILAGGDGQVVQEGTSVTCFILNGQKVPLGACDLDGAAELIWRGASYSVAPTEGFSLESPLAGDVTIARLYPPLLAALTSAKNAFLKNRFEGQTRYEGVATGPIETSSINRWYRPWSLPVVGVVNGDANSPHILTQPFDAELVGDELVIDITRYRNALPAPGPGEEAPSLSSIWGRAIWQVSHLTAASLVHPMAIKIGSTSAWYVLDPEACQLVMSALGGPMTAEHAQRPTNLNSHERLCLEAQFMAARADYHPATETVIVPGITADNLSVASLGDSSPRHQEDQ